MSRLPKRIGVLFLAFWIPLVTVAIGTLMSRHLVAMPSPTRLDVLRDYVVQLDATPTWRVLHLVPDGCSCTEGLLRHLLGRDLGHDPHEQLVMLGHREGLGVRAEAVGYHFVELAENEAVAGLHLDAAPVLVLVDPEGQLRYAGGYFDAPAAVHARTTRIVAAARAGQTAPLPVYGCVLTDALRRQVDPLGLEQLQDVASSGQASQVQMRLRSP